MFGRRPIVVQLIAVLFAFFVAAAVAAAFTYLQLRREPPASAVVSPPAQVAPRTPIGVPDTPQGERAHVRDLPR